MVELFYSIFTIWIVCFQMDKGNVSLFSLSITSYHNEISIRNIRFHTVSVYFNKQETIWITEFRADMDSMFYA